MAAASGPGWMHAVPGAGGAAGAGWGLVRAARRLVAVCRWSARQAATIRGQAVVHRSLASSARNATKADVLPAPMQTARLRRASTTSVFARSTVPLPTGQHAASHRAQSSIARRRDR